MDTYDTPAMSYSRGGLVSRHVNNTVNKMLERQRNDASSETLL